ncbi:acyl-CoA dehydrogenase family protein [Pararhodobacter sp.]
MSRPCGWPVAAPAAGSSPRRSCAGRPSPRRARSSSRRAFRRCLRSIGQAEPARRAMIKLVAPQMESDVAERAMQTFGEMGLTSDTLLPDL